MSARAARRLVPAVSAARPQSHAALSTVWLALAESKLTKQQREDHVRVKLFEEGIEAKDVAQGELGNCWLVAALACMAEFPGLIHRVFVTARWNAAGKYVLRLYDGQERKWIYVHIDEWIPTKNGHALFAQAHGNEMWVMMIEKVRLATYSPILATCSHFVILEPISLSLQ